MLSPASRPPAGHPPLPACFREAYARLFEAHARGATQGRPLLTADGEAHVRGVIGGDRTSHAPGANGTARHRLPRWEAAARRLWLGGRLLKGFRQPAPYQAQLLSAFEHTAWAESHVEDPLPVEEWETCEDAKRRLHETIRNLNRSLPAGTIRFRGDGTGRGVIWEFDTRGERRVSVSMEESYPKATP